jgi:UDP-GlcNAc:undecaprenyl-phosphate GlcNAc-1-phosphate transferase
MNNFLVLAKVLITSSLLSFIFSPIVIKVYKKLNLLDDPRQNDHPKVLHQYPVPRGGGIPIFLSLLISVIIFLPLDKHLLGILIGALLILIIGVLDDIYDLNPYLRLLAGFLAAGCVVASGIGIAFVTNPFGGIIQLNQPQIPFYLFGSLHTIWVLSDLVALIWIVWCMNFVNWSKGLDGQLPGIVVIAALTIALLSLRYSADITQWPVIILALITAGAYLGFTPWNFYPQKIMPGYGGGALAGFLLAVLSILTTSKINTLMVVLSVPMIDAFYSIIRRILQGRSPVWGDRGHLHHRLIDLDWGKRKIALFYWAITALMGFLALKLNSKAKFYTIILLTIILGGTILWLKYLISSFKQHDQSSG